MNEPWEYYAKSNKPDTKGKYCMMPLIWGTQNKQNWETDNRAHITYQGLGEGKMDSHWLMGTEFLFGMIKSSRNG